MPSDALDVAIVASWYPTPGDPGKGRFVADQAAALLASGEVRPVVISFDPAMLSGSQGQRRDLAALVLADARRAIADSDDVFAAAGVAGPPGVPVARLPVPEGRTAADPVLHALHSRASVLEALAARWPTDGGAAGPLPPPPRLVHAHTGYPDGAAAASLATRLDVPLLITEHASFLAPLLARPDVRAAYLAAVRQAARLIAVSEALAAELRAALPEVAERIVVIPNAVPVEAFAMTPHQTRREGELLYVGHRTEGKGLPTLLAALARVRTHRPDVTLRLVGRAPHPALEARWRRLAGELGVAEAVTFDPVADRAGVAEAMARASLFVHASRRETFGVVAVEALAAGLPVVATDSGGVTEIMGPDPSTLGAVVPVDDADAMAAAIDALLARRGTFDAVAARALVAARYGATAVARRLLDLYRLALDERGDGAGLAAAHRAGPTAAWRPSRVDRSPTILLALDPDRAGLAEALVAPVRRRVVVVTSAGPGGPRPDAVGGTVRVRLGGLARGSADAAALASVTAGRSRLAMAVRHPGALARRRGLLPGTARLVQARGAAGLRAALAQAEALPEAGGRPILVVCGDGFDHLAATAAARSGRVRLAPGGIRWLGDHGDPDGEPARQP